MRLAANYPRWGEGVEDPGAFGYKRFLRFLIAPAISSSGQPQYAHMSSRRPNPIALRGDRKRPCTLPTFGIKRGLLNGSG
ncbi:hypothetical protein AVEN_229037-1 [Araneus ventricosus]|uniref:Uncharacterized protein n=1 Tax=Araneus ventricosus TaxID=182803 RepID=A0A4Y2CZ59_ARAVE|nr:hypothetical protein AVEN_229037-1 [Araneus ventricosus]